MNNTLLKKGLSAEQNVTINSIRTYKKKSKGIAYLLWFALGMFGVHRFYGDIGIGIAMALTGGGCGVWFLIDVFFIGKRIDIKNMDVELNRGQENRLLSEQRLIWSGIHDVDAMSGEAFEVFLKILFEAKGYKVSLTPSTGDYGADLILSAHSKKIAVQAKRHASNVGVSAVQEIVSAKSYYGADECWVVTNSFFTANAVTLASSNNVILIDREKLIEWMVEERARV